MHFDLDRGEAGKLARAKTASRVATAHHQTPAAPTLAENLKDINSTSHSDHWIDLVIVLDKGFIGYALQTMMSNNFIGWLGGPPTDEFVIPPFYIHLAQVSCGEETLNHFFLRLMAHLTFFRKISGIDFTALMKPGVSQTIQGYQYN
jgi:hypothetical protein